MTEPRIFARTIFTMRYLLPVLSLFLLLTVSCKEDDSQQLASRARDLKKKEAVFASLQKNWVFQAPALNPQTQEAARDWQVWRQFQAELRQKPQSSVDAFRKKAKTLTQRVRALSMGIPIVFDKPEIRARITALTVTIQSLDLYVNLDDIPIEKVIACIREINLTLGSMTTQMEEIIARGNVRLEKGESDMLRMLDTTRAIPSTPKPKQLELQ